MYQRNDISCRRGKRIPITIGSNVPPKYINKNVYKEDPFNLKVYREYLKSLAVSIILRLSIQPLNLISILKSLILINDSAPIRTYYIGIQAQPIVSLKLP